MLIIHGTDGDIVAQPGPPPGGKTPKNHSHAMMNAVCITAMLLSISKLSIIQLCDDIIAAAEALALIESEKDNFWEAESSDWESICVLIAKRIVDEPKPSEGWDKFIRSILR